MSVREVKASDLKRGDVLALPFGKTATLRDDPVVGRQYVQFVTEHGKSRVGVHDPVLLERRMAEP